MCEFSLSMPRIAIRVGLLLSALGIAFAGCRKEVAKLETSPVTGSVVAADGKPLGGGAICFQSVRNPAIEALAEIKPDGSFALYTMHSGSKFEGSIPGPYKVSVVPPATGMKQGKPIRLSETYTIRQGPNQITIYLKQAGILPK